MAKAPNFFLTLHPARVYCEHWVKLRREKPNFIAPWRTVTKRLFEWARQSITFSLSFSLTHTHIVACLPLTAIQSMLREKRANREKQPESTATAAKIKEAFAPIRLEQSAHLGFRSTKFCDRLPISSCRRLPRLIISESDISLSAMINTKRI